MFYTVFSFISKSKINSMFPFHYAPFELNYYLFLNNHCNFSNPFSY